MTKFSFRKLAASAAVALHLGFESGLNAFVRAEGDSDSEDALDDMDKEETPEEVAEKTAGLPVVLTDANLKDELKKAEDAGKPIFIKFYAPWCGHCKRMAGTWDELAADLHNSGEAVIAKMDVTDENAKESGSTFAIRGFPTLKLVKGDRLYNYEGARVGEALKKFAQGGYLEASSTSLPWNQTFVDKAKKYIGEYLEKFSQVHGYEPTLIPLVFAVGAFFGIFLGFLMSYGVSGSSTTPEEPEAPKKKDSKKDK